jgi:ADP-dependent NAD(P)H-hydrate dehydratase / NAD(P)H-hydrate epimerase
MYLVTSEQMRKYDRQTIEELGVPGAVLMENAGRAAVAELLLHYGRLAPGPVVVLAGKGNNGGDGFVMALALQQQGWQVRTLVLAEAEQIVGDARFHLETLLESEAEVCFTADSDDLKLQLANPVSAILMVDAILGTGLESDVRGLAVDAINWINAFTGPVVAVDVPSGINASNGRICGVAVNADLTVSFAFAKIGLVVYPGAGLVGKLKVVDIGIPQQLANAEPDPVQFETIETARVLFPLRPATGHKGTFGHLLVVAGSRGKTGAAALSAEAGLRVGAGLTTLATAASVQPILATKLLEVMTEAIGTGDLEFGLADFDRLKQLARDKQALVIGPGLGNESQTVELICRLVAEAELPLVVDADGLNALSRNRHLLRGGRSPRILTPHPGEMARLSGLSIAEIETDRVGVARSFARENGVVLVLKGARTVTALPDGSVFINSSGNPGMASGGMGDVLAGMIGGLLAQGVPAGEAARLAVFWHGQAGDQLSLTMGTCGLLAGDLLRCLPQTRLGILRNGGSVC